MPRTQLIAIAKKLCLSSDGKIQLKLFAEMASFKEESIDIIGFNKKKKICGIYIALALAEDS